MSQTKVSIIVLGYLENNRHYLEACLRSVANLEYPKDLLDITLVSPYGRSVIYPQDVLDMRIVSPPEPGSFSKSVNAGIKASNKDSDYYLILSDDTVITHNALNNMVKYGDNCVIGPVSNCDNDWKYKVHLPVTGFERFYELGKDSELALGMMIKADSPWPQGALLTDTLCFYAVMIPRKVWNELGPLDESFNMGYEDSFYCYKARLAGYQCVVAMDALVYHAGGKSSELITPEMRENNERLFADKCQKLEEEARAKLNHP